MKSPLWIVNSALMVILVAMIAFIAFSFKNIFQKPHIVPIKIGPQAALIKKEVGKPKDLRIIYEDNDLFGTYRAAIIPVKEIETLPVIPRPPAPKPIMPQPKPMIQFLEPLPIKITGIIASNNETKSQVTVINNNSRKTESYRVGDKLFDSYILRILARKVIIIRSNGQQETLFMYPADAQEEMKNLKDASWTDVVQKQNDFSYLVNPTTFGSRITSLARFIDMLDITTAFKQGNSLGIRIGSMEHTSIGYALGFMPGDVITKVNGIAPTSTSNRLKVFNALAQLPLNSEIKVQFMRRGQMLTYTYTLFNLADMTASYEPPVSPRPPSIMQMPSMPTMPSMPMAPPTVGALMPAPAAPQVPREPERVQQLTPGLAAPSLQGLVPTPAQGAPAQAPQVQVTALPAAPQGLAQARPVAPAQVPQAQVATIPAQGLAQAAPQVAPTQTPQVTAAPAAPQVRVNGQVPVSPIQVTTQAPQMQVAPAPTPVQVSPIQVSPTQVPPTQSTPAPVSPAQASPVQAPTAGAQAQQQPTQQETEASMMAQNQAKYKAPIQQMKKNDYEAMKQFGSKSSMMAPRSASTQDIPEGDE